MLRPIAALCATMTLLQRSIADLTAPQSISILNTTSSGCDVPISTHISGNNTILNILYDASKSNGTTSDVLAWTDSTSYTETTCNVCLTLKWNSALYGLLMSVDYDFYHRVDLGLLELVGSTVTKDNGTSEVLYPDPFHPFSVPANYSVINRVTSIFHISMVRKRQTVILFWPI